MTQAYRYTSIRLPTRLQHSHV